MARPYPHPNYAQGSARFDGYSAYHQDAYANDCGPAPARGMTWEEVYGRKPRRDDDAHARRDGAYDGLFHPEGAYSGHGHADGCAGAQPSNDGWRAARTAGGSVQGAPAAPKKMRDAAAAAAAASQRFERPQSETAGYGQAYNSHAYPRSGPAYFEQQRDYHSAASRCQPYVRTPSVPGTPTHASAPRPVSSMAHYPQAIRAAPRQEYLEQAQKESRQLSEQEAKHRKLLVVLDLNGTLVFRAKNSKGRGLDSARAVPRPFLDCFLQYCLGVCTPGNSHDTEKSQAKVVEAEQRPHGSQFWCTSSDADEGKWMEPRSGGRAEVVVWSSAQPANVDSMVRASFDESVRSKVLRVWARDTLIPHRLFQMKAESTKDLEIVWAELNAFAHDLASPGRILAETRDWMDQLRPDDAPLSTMPTAPAPKKYKGTKNKERQRQHKNQRKPMSAALEAAKAAEELGPWGVENTVLVDDSAAKARLQRWNHVWIPEFGKVDAARMRKFVNEQLGAASAEGAQGVEVLGELEYDWDVWIENEPSATVCDVEQDMEQDMEQDGKEQHSEEKEEMTKKKKRIPESGLDDVLLQTIGVLETLRVQSNVSAFIRSGGIEGYGRPKTALDEQQRLGKVDEGKTPEFWADKGRETCEQLGIQVRAWVGGAAACASAALV